MKCCLVIDISKINLKIISVVLREDKIFMQEIHRCSKILIRNKDSKLSLNIDKIIKENNKIFENLRNEIILRTQETKDKTGEEIRNERYAKFRQMGEYKEIERENENYIKK